MTTSLQRSIFRYVGSTLLLFGLLPVSGISETLLSEKIVQGEVALTENQDNTLFTITSGLQPEIVDLFDLENPSRIVMDVKNVQITKNKSLSPKNNALIKKIRLGKHSDKTRFVFDLKSGVKPEYKWSPAKKNSIQLAFLSAQTDSSISDITPQLPQIETAEVEQGERGEQEEDLQERKLIETSNTALEAQDIKQEDMNILPLQQTGNEVSAANIGFDQNNREMPKKEETVPNSDRRIEDSSFKNNAMQASALQQDTAPQIMDKIEDVKKSDTEIPEPFKKKVAPAKPKKNAQGGLETGPQGLENIKFYFQKEKNTPLVRFILVRKPEYTLKKESDKKYILTIPSATIRWPHLELPQFPPRNFRGFTMVMAEKRKGDLKISIGVERGSTLTSFTKENEVWLKINKR